MLHFTKCFCCSGASVEQRFLQFQKMAKGPSKELSTKEGSKVLRLKFNAAYQAEHHVFFK